MPEPKLSKGYSLYGADMGRCSHGEPKEGEKIRLYKMSIDSGGYDNGGAYWGLGEPMFRAFGEDFEYFTRAEDRDDAKELVINAFPDVNFSFYR